MDHSVLFVCEHGAGRSRVAAALFNSVAPPGWRASSAGLSPQEHPSEYAATLLTGSPAADLLEVEPPRVVVPADLTVAIDCDLPRATRWRLRHEWPDARVTGELRELTAALARELA